VRAGDFEPLPAIGQRRRWRNSDHKTGHGKIVLFLALLFVLAACAADASRCHDGNALGLSGTIDANGNVAVPR
jgi:hypothetical protein